MWPIADISPVLGAGSDHSVALNRTGGLFIVTKENNESNDQ